MKIDEIVHTALDNLETGHLKGRWQGYEETLRDNGIDGVFALEVEGSKEAFNAIVKRNWEGFNLSTI